jgi:hypothetical protein
MTKRTVRPASLAVFATLLAGLTATQGARLHAQDAPATSAATATPAAPAQPALPAAPPVAAPAPRTIIAAPAAAPAPRAIIAAPAAAPAPRTIIPAPPLAGAAAPETAAAAELEALVAPVALYPDPLLGQLLVAATYPLEIIQAQQWLASNPDLKGDSLLEAVQKQPWDPSVQALVAFPDVIKRLSENISWTTDLGNAFLAQQSEVMDAVQRLRLQATQAGKLTSSEQQSVTTKQVEQRTVVEIQPTSTQIVYVPVYSPAVVWGPPVYPYPTIYYPPPPRPGALLISFGVGMAVGAAIHHGGWGYGCGWGHSNVVVVNHHNTFIRNTGVQRDVQRRGGSSSWQHDASHRGNVPYANSQVANRYGGSARAPRQAGQAPAPRVGAFDGVSRRAGADAPRGFERGFATDRARGPARESGFGDKRDFGERGGSGEKRERRGGAPDEAAGERGSIGDKRHAGERGGVDGPRGLERSFDSERAREPARESGFGEKRERSGGVSERGGGFSQRGSAGEKRSFSEPTGGVRERGGSGEKRERSGGFSERGGGGSKRGVSERSSGGGGTPRASGARGSSRGGRKR